MCQNLRQVIYKDLNVIKDDGSLRYLGMPIMVGKKKQEVFNFVKNKLKARVNGW